GLFEIRSPSRETFEGRLPTQRFDVAILRVFPRGMLVEQFLPFAVFPETAILELVIAGLFRGQIRTRKVSAGAMQKHKQLSHWFAFGQRRAGEEARDLLVDCPTEREECDVAVNEFQQDRGS